jgi:hypothetical protein
MARRDRALMRNAADPRQVARAARKEREQGVRWEVMLRATLMTVEGRATLWELLARAGVFRSIFDPSSRIYYNAGRQDFGHELLAEITRVAPDLYIRMEAEARTHQASLDREAEAADVTHQRARTEEDDDDGRDRDERREG